jgi:hypothetical protein
MFTQWIYRFAVAAIEEQLTGSFVRSNPTTPVQGAAEAWAVPHVPYSREYSAYRYLRMNWYLLGKESAQSWAAAVDAAGRDYEAIDEDGWLMGR